MSRETDPLSPGATVYLTLSVRALRWTFVKGPQAGATLTVDGDHATIGTAADQSVRLADTTASRRHAVVTVTPEGLLVRDLGSKNGTFVNGAKVREAFLAPGAELTCGSTTLTVEACSDELPVPPQTSAHFGEMLGESHAMRQLFALLARVAATEMTLVLNGETGTGKDVAARAVHAASARAQGLLVVLDCAAVDRELVSSELFGHEVGAFTGAAQARAGAFEQAKGGTLFIDEIGELPMDLQPKLLRALERREVKRLGGAKVIGVDCRVIAATHRDLREMVAAGTFRQDLYYRLAQVVVRLPPLRERREDISRLVEAFGRGSPRRFSPAALALLAAAPYPGNVRELKNVVESSLALAPGPVVEPADVRLETDRAAAPPDLDALERDAIQRALEKHGFHRGRVAAELGISDTTLRAKIKRYGLWVPPRD